MRDQECRAFGDKEPFDFYLSAFLNAGTSFRDEFHVRQDRKRNDTIKAWRKVGEDGLSLGDNALYQFMGKDRIAEVHHEGSARSAKTEEIPVGNIYSDASGTVTSSSGTLMAEHITLVVLTVNSIPLAQSRESGDACVYGRHAQTDLVDSHRAIPITNFARAEILYVKETAHLLSTATGGAAILHIIICW